MDSSHGSLLILESLPAPSVSSLCPLLWHCYDLLINSNSALYQLYSNSLFSFLPSFSITSMSCNSDKTGLSADGFDSARTLEAKGLILLKISPGLNPAKPLHYLDSSLIFNAVFELLSEPLKNAKNIFSATLNCCLNQNFHSAHFCTVDLANKEGLPIKKAYILFPTLTPVLLPSQCLVCVCVCVF